MKISQYSKRIQGFLLCQFNVTQNHILFLCSDGARLKIQSIGIPGLLRNVIAIFTVQ